MARFSLSGTLSKLFFPERSEELYGVVVVVAVVTVVSVALYAVAVPSFSRTSAIDKPVLYDLPFQR